MQVLQKSSLENNGKNGYEHKLMLMRLDFQIFSLTL